MHHLERKFSDWIINNRALVILLCLVLLIASGYGTAKLGFTTSYRVFFGADNPQLQAFDTLENTYAREDNVMFALAPKNGNVFTRETLSAVESLTQAGWQIPYSTRVDSITNFQHTEADGDDLIVRDLVENAARLDDPEIGRIRRIALNEPLLVNRLVSPPADVTAVNITIRLPRVNEATETPEVTSAARALADKIRHQYPDIDVYLTGMIMMNNAFSEASVRDMMTLVPLSFAVMLVILALLLRSLAATFASLLVILFSIITAMGLAGHTGMKITPPSASAPTIILTIAIASSVHLLVSLLWEIHHGATRKVAASEALRINLQPIFITSLTTALGFMSMNFSDSPPFRHLGNLVATGVAASFIYTVTFLPALMTWLPVRTHGKTENDNLFMARLADFVISRRRLLLVGLSAVAMLLVAQIPRNELNDNFVAYFDESVDFRRDTDFVDRHLGGLYRIDYSLQAQDSGGVSDPRFLESVARFVEWWRQQPETVHVNSITDTMTRLNMNMHGDDPAWYRLPDNRQLAAQYLLLYEMSLPFGLDLNNQINVDKSATRVSVTTRVMSTSDILALEKRATAWLQVHDPDIADTEGTSTTIMFSHIGKRNINSMLIGTSVALVLISAILIIALRSLRIGLISLVPNLLPAAIGFGVWGIVVGEIGLSLSIVAGMTLGIVVDDTVHFLSKYLRAKREHGYNPEKAVRYAFTRVGKALWITSVVLVCGFLILALSSFEMNAGMGLLTAIVIAIALAADFLLLPPLLLTLDREEGYSQLKN